MRGYPRGPAVEIRGLLILLNRTGPFVSDSTTQPWRHCRDALRRAVHRDLVRLLKSTGQANDVTEMRAEIDAPAVDVAALFQPPEPKVRKRTAPVEPPKASAAAPPTVAKVPPKVSDLVPHTCLNPSQARALARKYEPRAKKLGLPVVSLPPVPKAFADDSRRQEVLAELEESKAELVILLGDEPVRHWLSKFDDRWKRLSDFGAEYGRRHRVVLGGKSYEVLPLAHSRQVAGLGSHSVKWRAAQEAWTASDAGRCPRRHVCAVAPR